ncbi:MAG TPA: serine/threonine-protein kinase [Ktedonobacterales bacterium]
MASLLGQQLGDYVLQTEIGRGSMGVVYRAMHVRQHTEFAVKVLLEQLGNDESFVIRFNQEADVVQLLHHDNIIRVFGRGSEGDRLYFVMEYYPGSTAGQLLKRDKRLSARQVLDIAQQTADALAYAHTHGHLVHRDIKPENLLVGEGWKVKVLDFGLARIEGAKSITSAGTVVGSLYYVSPEQLKNHTLDGRSDVYALGVSMYEMLCGRRPFLGHSFTELSTAILRGNCVPLGQAEPTVPLELERVVARAMAVELEDRYSSAAELWHDLRAARATLFAREANADPFAQGALDVALVKPQQTSAPPRLSLRPASLVPAPPEGQDAGARKPPGAPRWDE